MLTPFRRAGWSAAGRLAAAPGALYLLFVLTVLLSLTTSSFLTPTNLVNVALQAAVLLIVALGMTLVILTEGIDLSAGSVLGLAGVVTGWLAVASWPLAAAIAAALTVGAAIGLINGILVAHLGLPAFVATLGTFGMAQSLAMVITEGHSITRLPPAVRWFNEGEMAGIPVPLWVIGAVFVLTWVLLYRTRFGRYVFALGGNRQALLLTGVRVRAYQAGVYAFAGLLTAVASFIMTARMNAAHPTIGIGLEFDAIAAVVLGGTSFDGGRGGLFGTALGAVAVGVLRNGLNLIGLSTEWQVAAVGLVIILTVGLDALRRTPW